MKPGLSPEERRERIRDWIVIAIYLLFSAAVVLALLCPDMVPLSGSVDGGSYGG